MIAKSQGLPEAWDEQADLVVVGTGGAGMTGALVAAIEGASVIVLEKTEFIGGTTAISGGGLWIAANHHMAERGVDDTFEEALEYVRACCGDAADDEMLVALVESGAPMVRYLEERAGLSFRPYPAVGGTLDYRPWLSGWKPGPRMLESGKMDITSLGDWSAKVRFGAQSVWQGDKFDFFAERWHTLPPNPDAKFYGGEATDRAAVKDVANGTALITQLLRACLEREVEVRTDVPVEQLLVDDGRVVGVRATIAGETVFVRAEHGVLIATGGYSHNEALKRAFMTRPLEYSCELRTNQGDGLLMGMAIGAQLSNLGDAWWGPMLPLKGAATPDRDAVMIREDRSLPHTIMVNRLGRRFVNESLNYYDIVESFGTKQNGAVNTPAWVICDHQARSKYRIFAKAPTDPAPGRYGGVGVAGDVDEPEAPPERSWLVSADTLEELAGELGIDPAGLVAGVERFNEFARTGKDLDFGRGESQWDIEWGDQKHGPNPALGTIEVGPFYAAELRPGALATKGGLRINPHGQVLSAAGSGDPIPGLYAAGNCSSGGPPQAYPGGGATIGAGMTFGYLAGKHVAAAAASRSPETSGV